MLIKQQLLPHGVASDQSATHLKVGAIKENKGFRFLFFFFANTFIERTRERKIQPSCV